MYSAEVPALRLNLRRGRTTISGSPASHGLWSPASADPLAQSLAGVNAEDLRQYMPDHDITRQLPDNILDDLSLDEPFLLQSGASSQRSGRSGHLRRSDRKELYSDSLDVSYTHSDRLAGAPTTYGNGNGSLSSHVSGNNASANGVKQLAVHGHGEGRTPGRQGRSPSREDHLTEVRRQRSPSPAHTRTAGQRNGGPAGNTAALRTSNSLRGDFNLESQVPASYHTMDMGGLSMSLLRSSHGSSQAPFPASPMRLGDSSPAVPVSPAASHGSGGILDIMNSMLADSYRSASAASSAKKGRNETLTTATGRTHARAHDVDRRTVDSSPPVSPPHATAPPRKVAENGSPANASASFPPRVSSTASGAGALSQRSREYELQGEEVFALAASENADASAMLESVKRRGSFEEVFSEEDDDDLDIEDAAALSQSKPNLGQSRTDSNLSLQALRNLEAHGATSIPPGIVIQHVSPRDSTSYDPTLEEGYPGPVPIFRLDAPPEETPWQRRLSAEQADRAASRQPGTTYDAALSIPPEDDGDYEDPVLLRQRSGTPLAIVDDASEDDSVSNTSTPSLRISAGEVKATPSIKTPAAQISPGLGADALAPKARPNLRRQSLTAEREEVRAVPPRIRIDETLGRRRTMSLQTSIQSNFDFDRELKLSPKNRRNTAVAPVAR